MPVTVLKAPQSRGFPFYRRINESLLALALVEPTQYVTHEASTADTHNDIKPRAWLILLVFAVFHQQVLHVGLSFHPSLNNLVKRSFRLYLVHEHGARVSGLVLPDGAYKAKLEYGSPDNLTEVVFIFYASMLTMSKK